MRKNGLLAACSSFLLLAGCFPIAENIYRPEATGGKLEETSCRYNSGPGKWDRIVIQQNKLEFTVHAFRIVNPDSFRIHVGFSIPKGQSATLVSPVLKLSFIDSSSRLEMHTTESTWWNQKNRHNQSWQTPMINQSEGALSTTNYSVLFDLPSPQIINGNFDATLPNIIINNEEIKLPIIRFYHETNLRLASINC